MSNKDVSLGFSHSYDDGASPSVALRDDGVVVEVHQSQGAATLWCHVGLVTGGVVRFGAVTRYDDGRRPRIAMNKQAVVEVHESDGTSSNMWCHVGTVEPATLTVGWGSSRQYDKGNNPSVAMNEQGIVVEVHESNGKTSLWYHVGTVDASAKTIDWGGSVQYDNGTTPAVALNGSGVVVEVHQSEGAGADLWYRVGMVDAVGKSISWGPSVNYDKGSNPSVALTEDGRLIEIHQSQTYNTLWKRVGQVDAGSRTIRWQGAGIQYSAGKTPAVASNAGQAIEVHGDGGGVKYSISTWMDRANWLQDNLLLLGGYTLKQLVLPASHDACMYEAQNCLSLANCGANANNTQTQILSIGDQLRAGVRYFDIRPVLRDGVFYTGHFTGALGCEGPALSTVLDDVATFMGATRELVILKFSHYYNRDHDGGSDGAINASQLQSLGAQVSAALEPWLYTGGEPLATLPLSGYIASQGIVLPVFDGAMPGFTADLPGLFSYADYNPDGSSRSADLTVYDSYADTNDLNGMITDQLGKLADTADHGGDLFLLSWTLTQDNSQVIAGGAQSPLLGIAGLIAGSIADTILDLAGQANTALWPSIVDALANGTIRQATVPNLLYIDASTGFTADLALWLNQNLRIANRLGGAAAAGMVPGDRVWSPAGDCCLTYQPDGNLVLYAADGRALWSSDTCGEAAWRTFMQADGNLVVYSAPGTAVFASGTDGNPGALLLVEDGGRIQLVSSGGTLLWQAP